MIETTWLRWFRLLFGATAPAAAATLVALFVGQALGAALAARHLPRVRRPLLAWAALEGTAALWALAVPTLLAAGGAAIDGLYADLVERPVWLTTVRLGTAVFVTLPAALCMGAVLPAAGAALVPDAGKLGTTGTGLYAWHLAGAAVGAALAATILTDGLGVTGAYGVGVGILVGLALALIAIGRGAQRALPERALGGSDPTPGASGASGASGDGGLLALAALSGFGALAAQVLLVRSLGLVLDQSVYAFAAVLVVVLAGLAGGAALVSLALRHDLAAAETLAAAGLALGALGLGFHPAVLHDLTDGLRPLVSGGGLAAFGAAVRLVALSAGPALLPAGLVLPALFAAAGRRGGAAERHLGRLSAANTAGAIAGALCAPFVLLVWMTPFGAFLAVALVWAIAAVFVPLAGRRTRLRRDVVLAFGWIALFARANPLDVPLVRLEPGETLEAVSSSAAGIVAVVARDDGLLLRTDSHYTLGGTADRAHQERQGALARLLRPGAQRAAWVGSATGISASALAREPLERLVLVELMPGVAEAAARWFAVDNRGVHVDPHTRVVLDDARSFLRATAERFDLVVADLYVPWRAGAGSLYTAEHFAAVRAHLAGDGVFVQWLPLYQLEEEAFLSIAATFLDAFPSTSVFRGDFFGRYPIVALVGFAGAAPSPDAVAAATQRSVEAGVDDRWVTHPSGVFSLHVGPLAPLRPQLASVARNTDGRPRVEYLAAGSGTSGGLHEPLVGLRWIRFVDQLQAAAAATGDPIFPVLPADARRAMRAGSLLQAASAQWSAGRADRAAPLLAAARAGLPEAFLDPNRPDPSAADLWPDD